MLPYPLVLLALAATVPAAFILAGYFAIGVVSMLFGVYWHTALQRAIPADRLGVVLSVDQVGSFGLEPFGYAVAGVLAESIDPRKVASNFRSWRIGARGLVVHRSRETARKRLSPSWAYSADPLLRKRPTSSPRWTRPVVCSRRRALSAAGPDVMLVLLSGECNFVRGVSVRMVDAWRPWR